MDTKLRNRHRISALLSVIVVVAAAVVMVGLYPFFEKEAGSYEQPAYEEQAFLRHLIYGNYVLYLEQAQYEQGTVISPFSLYFPQADEELRNEQAGITGSNAGNGSGLIVDMEENPDEGENGAIDDSVKGDDSPAQEPAAPDSAGPGVADTGSVDTGSADTGSVDTGSLDTDDGFQDHDSASGIDGDTVVEAGIASGVEISTDTQPQENAVQNIYNEKLIEEREDRLEYLKELRQNCVVEYENWNRYFTSQRRTIDYQVIDENGKVLLNHAGERDILTDQNYVFKAVMHYDSVGRMEVTQLNGQNTSYLLNLLQSFGEVDPMESYYWERYLYETSYKLDNPKNMTFAYAMTQDQLAEFGQRSNYSWRSYYESGAVAKVLTGMLFFVMVMAFFASFWDVTRADASRILRTPLEIVAGVTFGAVAFGYGLTSLVAMTNQGSLYDGLLRANFLPRVAGVMVTLWNILWWCVPFAVVYWAILCIRDIFHIGLKRYFRERTLCGWICGGCSWCCRRVYAFVSSINLQDRSDKSIFKIVGVNFIILAVLCSLWFFGIGALVVYSIIVFIVLRKYYHDLSDKYRILLKATNQIAEGNLEGVIEEDLGVFEPFKNEIEKIQSGFKVAVDEEVKSQKMKTDLITNMSHDLKTPLTAIITYVNLLKEENVTPEQRKAYIDVLEQKSMRLKSLIEDLFEISKANSNNVILNLVDVDIVSLLKEVSLELSDKIEESTIDFRWNLPDEKIVLPLDSQKTYRIFDNLLTNIIKYGMPNTRAYITMKREDDWVVITMKNVSANELTFNPEEITDRFVRGDQARNTEGSGLGMAIAKSFVELQNGKMNVEVEADLFRVIIRWPIGPRDGSEETM